MEGFRFLCTSFENIICLRCVSPSAACLTDTVWSRVNNLKNAVRENGENNAEEKRVIFNYGVKYSLHVQLPDIARLYMVFQILFSVFRKKIL